MHGQTTIPCEFSDIMISVCIFLTGTPNQLLHNLKTLVDVLSHMENTIVKTITDKSHVRTKLCFSVVLHGQKVLYSLFPFSPL